MVMTEMKAGYKQTEIGVIPEDWEVAALGNLFQITSSKRVFQKEWRLSGIPFYRARELSVLGEKGKVDNELFIDKNLYEKYKKNYGIPQIDDILVTGVGTLGKVYVVDNGSPFYFKDGNIIWFKIKEKINSHFLKQLYYSPLIEYQIAEYSAGSTVGTYTITGAKKTLIPFPKLEEQTAIATALSDVDGLIESLEQLIAKKRDIKTAVMQQLLTGKKRLPGFVGEWEEKSLGDFLEYEQPTNYLVSSTKYFENGDTPVLTANKSFILGYTSEINNIYTNFPVIIFDDFTTASKFVCFKFKVKSSAIKILKPKCNSINLKYLYERMQLINFHLSDHKRYWITEYQNIRIPFPKLEEQTAIAAILSDMDAEIEALEQRLEKVRHLKTGMMQELLTGKTRLIETPKQASQSSSGHNQPFEDAVVIAVLAGQFSSEQYPLRRFRYTKFSYLIYRYNKMGTEQYLKKAAGPYNPQTRYGGGEKIAEKQKYVKIISKCFFVGDNIQQAREYFDRWFESDTLKWLEQFRSKTNEELELLTTIDNALLDLRKKNQDETLSRVKQVLSSHQEWKDKLRRDVFSDSNIEWAIRESQKLFGVTNG